MFIFKKGKALVPALLLILFPAEDSGTKKTSKTNAEITFLARQWFIFIPQ
jgi:hypothetical protein